MRAGWWVVVAFVAESVRAWACEPPPPMQLRDILPADGATGVPTNAQVRLDYFGFTTTGLTNVAVAPVGGAAVATTVTMQENFGYPLRHLVVMRPTDPLPAQTQYEIRASGTVIAMFRTGDGPDTRPPTFAGLESASSTVSDCPSSACCGPYRVSYVGFTWSSALSDDGPISNLRFNLYSGLTLVVPMSKDAPIGYTLCGGSFTGGGPNANFQGGSGTYRLRVVDIAGNEDANTITRDVAVSCALPPDGSGGAGAGAAGGAGGGSAGAGGGVGNNMSGSGCGCSISAQSNVSGVLPIFLALWCRRSKKPRVR